MRSLGLRADDFPVDVQLLYQVRPTPAPGEPPARPDDAGRSPRSSRATGSPPRRRRNREPARDRDPPAARLELVLVRPRLGAPAGGVPRGRSASSSLLHLAFIAPDLDHWLSDAGLVRGAEAREVASPFQPSLLQWVQDPISVRVFFGATVGVALLFLVGWRTRLMGVLLYLALLSIHHRMLGCISGADVLVVITSFYLMLSPCGAAYSMDARRVARRRGTEAEQLIVPWAQRLIQIQISLVYFVTAVWKANGAAWLDGTAMHYILNNGEIRRFTFGLTESPLALNAMAYGAILIEFALAFLLWVRKARPLVILSGIALHVGITAMINIPIFGELMTASYLTFLGNAEFAALRNALSPFGRKTRAVANAPLPDGLRVDGPSAIEGPPRDGARRGKPGRDRLALTRRRMCGGRRGPGASVKDRCPGPAAITDVEPRMNRRLPAASPLMTGLSLIATVALSMSSASWARAQEGKEPAATPTREGIHWPGEGGRRVRVSIGVVLVEFARINLREESFDMAGYLDASWVDPSLAIVEPARRGTTRRFRPDADLGARPRVRQRRGAGAGRTRGGPLRRRRRPGQATNSVQP